MSRGLQRGLETSQVTTRTSPGSNLITLTLITFTLKHHNLTLLTSNSDLPRSYLTNTWLYCRRGDDDRSSWLRRCVRWEWRPRDSSHLCHWTQWWCGVSHQHHQPLVSRSSAEDVQHTWAIEKLQLQLNIIIAVTVFASHHHFPVPTLTQFSWQFQTAFFYKRT